jgi:hypothetical protein
MSEEDIEPLTPELWFERIDLIANGQLGSTENALRHALHLLQLTPRQFRPREYGTIDEEKYEALLEAGDLDAAARTLVAAPTLTVSATSSPNGVEVAIGCKTLNMTVHGKGDSVAAAILQAWTQCLFMLRSEPDESWLNKASGR